MTDDDDVVRGLVLPPLFKVPSGLKDVSPPDNEPDWQVRIGTALAAWHHAKLQKRPKKPSSKKLLTRRLR